MARLSTRQKKNIQNSYRLTLADHNLIKMNQYSWDGDNLKPLRDRIREFYRTEQDNLCAFCKLPFRDDIQIEHMVPKGGKYGIREYSYHPQNLFVACKHCNSNKSTNNDMMPMNARPYPTSGLYFRILHPHFDDYFTHIEIVDKSRYVRKTMKGHHTIARCKLYHPRILEVLAECMKYQDDPVANAVFRIREIGGDFKEVIDRFVRKVFK